MELEIYSETLLQYLYRTAHETASYTGIVHLVYRLMCVSHSLHFFSVVQQPLVDQGLFFYRRFTITPKRHDTQ